MYFAGVRSYVEFYGIDTHRVKNRVTLPKKQRRRKQALTAEFIRTILLACNNTRLKVFILVLASSGMRANEALSLRNSDIDFDVSPTKVHIMAENTKTNQERDIYISREASRELKKFIESKYPQKDFIKYPDHLVFSIKTGSIEPAIIYRTLHNYFTSLLKKVELDKRRRGEGIQRREISFHTFRDYVKTTVAIHTNSDFSEWILGHIGSTYWNADDDATRELYLKCEKYLTFLDYPTVETIGKDFESKLAERDKEIDNINKELSRLKAFELDYNKTFQQRFKEMEANLDYYKELYGNPKNKNKK